jgi:hypothetical protein
MALNLETSLALTRVLSMASMKVPKTALEMAGEMEFEMASMMGQRLEPSWELKKVRRMAPKTVLRSKMAGWIVSSLAWKKLSRMAL